jgi:D-serine deaminase-like pyridoxal phosphate-dependent protein
MGFPLAGALAIRRGVRNQTAGRGLDRDDQEKAMLSEIDTPAVTILLDRVDANIRRVQSQLHGAGLANRPHIKTHKIPAIAKQQIAAGAIGITCQKLGEVEAFVDAGVADDILVTYNILGEAKTERLMALSKRISRLAVVLDNDVVAKGLSDGARRQDGTVRFLIECDTGFGRNGVQSPEEALALAQRAMALPRMEFEGLMTYPNGDKTAGFFTRALQLFDDTGIPVPVVSGGGTPAVAKAGQFPMMTEHRAGTYVYNDCMMVSAGAATWDDCAMYVRTTVVSRPTPNRGILDAGSKILTSDRYFLEGHGRIVEYPQARIVSLSEEHAMVDLSDCAERPGIGDVLNVVPNHCCVVSNMVDEVYGIRNGAVEVIWPVAARGAVR